MRCQLDFAGVLASARGDLPRLFVPLSLAASLAAQVWESRRCTSARRAGTELITNLGDGDALEDVLFLLE